MKISGKQVRGHLPAPDEVQETQHQLVIFSQENSVFADLLPVIFVNRTAIPFITSDNPAMYLNKLYSQRYGDPTGGLIQAGGIATMPLTPKVAMLAYDADVYKPIGREAVLEVRRESDVERLNELQVMRASGALFFQNLADGDYVRRLFQTYGSRRRAEWTVTRTFIRDGEDERFERFRRVQLGDRDSLEPRLQSMSPILPAPSTWPTFIKFKMRPRGWSNGTVVGYVREAHTTRSTGFECEVLPYRLPRHHVEMDVMFERKRPSSPAAR